LMSSQVDSRASRSALLENDKGRTTNDGSGLSSHGSFAWFDRDTYSWRMSQDSFFGGCPMYSETWPKAGTMRSGASYQRQSWERRISEIESGLLPTPTAREWKDRGRPCVLQKLARGDGVAKEIFKHSATHRLSNEITAGLNPFFALWMMGYPAGWTDLEEQETPSSHKSSSISDDASWS
jgi:hypothetical protein